MEQWIPTSPFSWYSLYLITSQKSEQYGRLKTEAVTVSLACMPLAYHSYSNVNFSVLWNYFHLHHIVSVWIETGIFCNLLSQRRRYRHWVSLFCITVGTCTIRMRVEWSWVTNHETSIELSLVQCHTINTMTRSVIFVLQILKSRTYLRFETEMRKCMQIFSLSYSVETWNKLSTIYLCGLGCQLTI